MKKRRNWKTKSSIIRDKRRIMRKLSMIYELVYEAFLFYFIFIYLLFFHRRSLCSNRSWLSCIHLLVKSLLCYTHSLTTQKCGAGQLKKRTSFPCIKLSIIKIHIITFYYNKLTLPISNSNHFYAPQIC